MLLNVLEISEGSHSYEFQGDKASWVMDCVKEAFSKTSHDEEASKVVFKFDLVKSCDNISIGGEIRIFLHLECVRCLETFETTVTLPIKIHLVPAPEATVEDPSEEVELEAKDLEFSYYRGDEIDLKEILREEVLLNAPERFVCRSECRGLCSQCGTNLNHETCHCQKGQSDPRWAPLKRLKIDVR